VSRTDSEAELRPWRPSTSSEAEDTIRFSTQEGVVANAVVAMPRTSYEGDLPLLRRQQLSHDIRHELGTIMLLASLLMLGPDVGPEGRQRARQLLGEARWLDQMQRAYEDVVSETPVAAWPEQEPIRVDAFTREVVAATMLSTSTKIRFSGEEAWAHADRLAFWRALRNVISNAVRAAGAEGQVDVRVTSQGGWTSTQVDDDGPGFGAVAPGTASLGLGIVQESVASWGGELQIRRGGLGGCCVRLRMPAAAPPDTASTSR
jgi:signal transduction histidine kinase